MRALPRMVAFLLASLLAFWFTVENATEIVRIDLVVFRIDAALPIVIFASILLGMAAALLVGWRADRRRRRALKRGSFDAPDAPSAPPRAPPEWAARSSDTTPE